MVLEPASYYWVSVEKQTKTHAYESDIFRTN